MRERLKVYRAVFLLLCCMVRNTILAFFEEFRWALWIREQKKQEREAALLRQRMFVSQAEDEFSLAARRVVASLNGKK